MRRKALVCLLTLVLTLGLAGSAWSAGHLPPADGKAVINYITKESPYTSWPLWPGKGKLYKGQHPHGAYLTTYISQNGLDAIESYSSALPGGTFVVKENYDKNKNLAAITVMYKKDAYNPTQGDWFWLKYAPDGTIEKEGKVEGCINCHQSARDNDWIFTGPIK